MPNIITATQQSARAIERMQRWHRKLADACRAGDLGAARHCARQLERAERDHDRAYRAARFPWEV